MGMTFYVFGMFLAWNRDWYRSIQHHTLWILPERLYFVIIMVLTLVDAYGGWRLWVCENWDANFAALLMAMLTMLFLNLFSFIMMVTKSSAAYLFFSFAYICFSVAFTVFGFINDAGVGIIGVFNIILGLIYFAFSLWTYSNEHHIHSHYGQSKIVRRETKASMSLTVQGGIVGDFARVLEE